VPSFFVSILYITKHNKTEMHLMWQHGYVSLLPARGAARAIR